MLSSDQRQQQCIPHMHSGFKFIHVLAEWLNIKTIQLDTDYQFFALQDELDIVVFKTQLVDYQSLQSELPPNILQDHTPHLAVEQ